MTQDRRHLIILLLVGIVAFLINNHVIIPDIMESRNLVTAREMVDDGHWLVPTMNGELRLEKPPLPTWIAALSEMILPGNWAAARIAPGLAGLMLLLFFYRLAKAVSRREEFAYYASLILCTSYNIILMSRTVSWDIYCHAFMMVGIYYLYRLTHEDGQTLKHGALAGLMFGLSFMSKGPVSLYGLLLPFIIACLLFDRFRQRQWLRPTLLMLAVAVIVGGAWYAYIWQEQAHAGLATLNKESGSWLNHNVRPWYYYATFFSETGCWALLTLTTLAIPYWTKRVLDRRLYLFSFTWMVVVVVLLSLLPEKKNRYLLPVLMPAALTMGNVLLYWIKRLHDAATTRTDRMIYYINCGLLLLAVVILCSGCIYLMVQQEIGFWLGVLLLVGFGLVFWMLLTAMRRCAAQCMIYGIVVLFAWIEIAAMPTVGRLFCNTEYRRLSELKQDETLRELPIYHNEADEMRIETVYDARAIIQALDFSDSASVMQALPCILISHSDIDQELSPQVLPQVEVRHLGSFDGNRHRKGLKLYRDVFIYQTTLITPK